MKNDQFDVLIKNTATAEVINACRELMQAMRDYEIDADCGSPHPHREMMERARSAIEFAEKEKANAARREIPIAAIQKCNDWLYSNKEKPTVTEFIAVIVDLLETLRQRLEKGEHDEAMRILSYAIMVLSELRNTEV